MGLILQKVCLYFMAQIFTLSIFRQSAPERRHLLAGSSFLRNVIIFNTGVMTRHIHDSHLMEDTV